MGFLWPLVRARALLSDPHNVSYVEAVEAYAWDTFKIQKMSSGRFVHAQSFSVAAVVEYASYEALRSREADSEPDVSIVRAYSTSVCFL